MYSELCSHNFEDKCQGHQITGEADKTQSPRKFYQNKSKENRFCVKIPRPLPDSADVFVKSREKNGAWQIGLIGINAQLTLAILAKTI